MTKPFIYATGNETITGENNISYYILEKDEKFLLWLQQLLHEVFGGGETNATTILVSSDDEQGNFTEERYKKDLDKMVDVHEKFINKGDRMDVFYGSKRVYVTLRQSKDIREKLARFIKRTRDWIKIKEVQKVPFYAGKKIGEDDR